MQRIMRVVSGVVGGAVFGGLGGVWMPVAALAADTWPSHTIELVVPFAAGGAVDSVARLLASSLTTRLGQAVVVENRDGAGGMIGASFVARSAPDGYTLLLGTQTSLAVAPRLTRSITLDPRAAFAGVGLVAASPLLLVANPTFPPNNVTELIALARKKPGSLDFGSGGVGTTPHLAGELLSQSAGIKMTHIAYKGESPALTDVAGDQVPFMFSNLVAAWPLVQAGKLKALAISTPQRSPALPNVPTVAEAGVKGFDVETWFGIVTPKATPRPVVQRLAHAMDEAMKDPALRKKLEAQGLFIEWKGPTQFDAYISSEYVKWGKVVEEAKVVPQ